MTYFKYVEREVDNQVNWAEIGKNMTDMLKNEAEARFKKKQQIADKSREIGETLSNSPTGDFDAGNTFAANFANDMQQYRLMQDRMLQNGDLSLRDYTRNRQNSVDGTKQVFDLAKEYQAEYKTKMERWNNAESAKYEQWLMEQAEGLNNLGTVGTMTNPTNGVVSIGKKVKGKDGVMELSKDPNDFVTVAELRSRLKQQYDRFDVDGEAKVAAEQLGVVQEDVVKYASEGNLNTIISEIDAKKGNYGLEGEQFAATYKEWEEDQVSAMMVNGFNVMSVLTDRKVTNPATGKEYVPTFDEEAAKKDPNLIFIDRSTNPAGVPKFTDEQEEVVRETLKIAIRAQIDEKTLAKGAGTTQFAPSATISANKDLEKEADIVSTIGKLYYGDKNTGTSALSFLSGLDRNKNFYKMTRDTNGVQLFYTDDNGDEAITTLSFKDADGNTMSQEDFIISAASKLGGVTNVNEALAKSGFKKDAKFFGADATEDNLSDFSYEVAEERTQKLGFDQAFERNEGAKLDATIVLQDAGAAITGPQEDAAVQALQGMIASIPGTDDIKVRDFAGSDGIVIEIGSKKDGNYQRFEIELESEAADAGTKRTQAFEDAKRAIIAHAMESERFIRDEAQRQEYVDQFGTTRPGGGGSMENF